jgi:hypothetical protein
MSNAQNETKNQSQDNKQKKWVSKLFNPLDMTGIPGYPRKIPLGMKNGCLNSLVMM